MDDINALTGTVSRRDATDKAANEKNEAGVLAFTNGDTETAATLLEEALALAPHSAAHRRTLALIYHDLERYLDEAKLYVEIATITKSPEDFERAAEVFQDLGEDEAAMDCYEKASSSDPKNDRWLALRAETHYKLGEKDLALQCFRQAFDRLNAQRVDNKSSTVERAQHINDLDTRFYKTATQLATLAAELNEHKLSNDTWKKAYEKLMSDWELPAMVTGRLGTNSTQRPSGIPDTFLPIITAYTSILLRNEDWETAITLLEKAQLRVSVSDFPVPLMIASHVAKIRMGKFREIRGAFVQLLHKRNNVKDAKYSFFLLSDALLSCGEVEEALNVLLHVKAESNLEDTWMRLARCYDRKAGGGELCLDYWRQCFEASPANPEFALGLQNACRKYHRAEEGLEVARRHQEAAASTRVGGAVASSSFGTNSGSSSYAGLGAHHASASDGSFMGATLSVPNSSGLTHTGMLGVTSGIASESGSTKVSYAAEEHELELAFGHADLLWLNRRNAEHIAALTKIFQRTDIIFFRNRNRKRTAKNAENEPKDRANPTRKRGPRSRNSVLDSGFSSGISAIRTNESRNREAINDQMQMEEDFTMDYDEDEDDEEEHFRAVEAPVESEYVSAEGTKKRKRGRKPKNVPPVDMDATPDPLADAEHVTYAKNGTWEAVINKARLKEMKERKNLWEIVGLPTFIAHLSHFCRSLLFVCAQDGVVGAGGHYFWDEHNDLVHIRHNPFDYDHEARVHAMMTGQMDLSHPSVDGEPSVGPVTIKHEFDSDEYGTLNYASYYKNAPATHHYRYVDMWKVVDTVYQLVSGEYAFWDETIDYQVRLELRFIIAQVAYAFKAYQKAAELTRQVCHLTPDNPVVWHFYFKCVNQTREFYLSKGWTRRLVEKHPDIVPLQLLSGHLSLISRSYRFAIDSYLLAYNLNETSPATLLSLGVAFLGRALSRTCPDRNQALMRAFAFFYKYYVQNKYAQGSGSLHETYYNLARAFHHVSLYQYAIPLYKKVLGASARDGLFKDCTGREFMTLKREAAYNLAHIYRASGSLHLARELYADYLTF